MTTERLIVVGPDFCWHKPKPYSVRDWWEGDQAPVESCFWIPSEVLEEIFNILRWEDTNLGCLHQVVICGLQTPIYPQRCIWKHGPQRVENLLSHAFRSFWMLWSVRMCWQTEKKTKETKTILTLQIPNEPWDLMSFAMMLDLIHRRCLFYTVSISKSSYMETKLYDTQRYKYVDGFLSFPWEIILRTFTYNFGLFQRGLLCGKCFNRTKNKKFF